MALAISLGFVSLFAAFSLLSEQILHDSAARLLDERLIIAQMAANQVDNLLEEEAVELQRAYLTDAPVLPAEGQLAYQAGRAGRAEALSLAPLLQGGGVFASANGASSMIPADSAGALARGFPEQAEVTAISEPFVDPVTRQATVVITVPVYHQRRLVGFQRGLVNLNGEPFMATLLQAAALSVSGHASLVDRQGRALISTYGVPALSPGEHGEFYRQAALAGRPVIETVPFELDLPGETKGELHIMAFVPLKKAPWGVAVGGDLDETLVGVRRLRSGMAILGAIALVCVWMATLIGTRRLLKPIRELTEAARHIEGGKLHTPLNVFQTGEIGAMAASLEHMRLKLLSNVQELANWNETLEARVEEQTENLRQQQALTQQLLRRVITAQEEERARLSRELHDEIGQTLTALELSIERLGRVLPAGEDGAHRRLEQMRALTEQALVDLRRVIAALRPGVLDKLGLVPALGWISDHTLQPLGIAVTLQADGQENRLPSEVETVLFRIAQEAMNNVARHSQAKRLAIRLEQSAERVEMVLADDGLGWDRARASLPADPGRGLGLAGMRERACLVGGQVWLESKPGEGTAVRVVIPLPAPGRASGGLS